MAKFKFKWSHICPCLTSKTGCDTKPIAPILPSRNSSPATTGVENDPSTALSPGIIQVGISHTAHGADSIPDNLHPFSSSESKPSLGEATLDERSITRFGANEQSTFTSPTLALNDPNSVPDVGERLIKPDQVQCRAGGGSAPSPFTSTLLHVLASHSTELLPVEATPHNPCANDTSPITTNIPLSLARAPDECLIDPEREKTPAQQQSWAAKLAKQLPTSGSNRAGNGSSQSVDDPEGEHLLSDNRTSHDIIWEQNATKDTHSMSNSSTLPTPTAPDGPKQIPDQQTPMLFSGDTLSATPLVAGCWAMPADLRECDVHGPCNTRTLKNVSAASSLETVSGTEPSSTQSDERVTTTQTHSDNEIQSPPTSNRPSTPQGQDSIPLVFPNPPCSNTQPTGIREREAITEHESASDLSYFNERDDILISADAQSPFLPILEAIDIPSVTETVHGPFAQSHESGNVGKETTLTMVNSTGDANMSHGLDGNMPASVTLGPVKHMHQPGSQCTKRPEGYRASDELVAGGLSPMTAPSPVGAVVAPSIENTSIKAEHNVNITAAGRDVFVYNGMKDLDTETSEFLEWLSTTNSKAIQSETRDKVTPGTGEWFLETPDFCRLKKEPNTIIWGVGNPGAGKTYLSSVIINSLNTPPLEPSATVIYVYCRYDEHLTLPQLLANLLRQLAENSETICRNLKAKFHTHRGQRVKPSKTDIKDAFLSSLKLFARAFIVVDALDELSVEVRNDLVTILKSEVQASTLLTSRETVLDIPGPHFKIVPPGADIRAFVCAQVNGMILQKTLSANPDLLFKVAGKVEQACEELFLVAAFHVATLKESISEEELEKAAECLRKTDINEMYTTITQRIQNQAAYRAIGWVVYSKRPLRMEELQEAIAIGTSRPKEEWKKALVNHQLLISLCCGMLTYEEKAKTVRFIHVTAHEFFGAPEGRKLLLAQFPDPPHGGLAKACSFYMDMTLGRGRLQQDVLQTAFREYPFLEHACRFIGAYILLSMVPSDGSPVNAWDHEDDEGDFSRIEAHVIQYIPEALRLAGSLPLLTALDPWPTKIINQGGLAHFAALHGLTSLLRSVLRRNTNASVADRFNINEATEEEGMTPLYCAAVGGHLGCLSLLLAEKEIKVMLEPAHKHKRTALVAAKLAGQRGAFNVLLEDHRERCARKYISGFSS